jgi:DNA polymerase-1
MIPRRLQDDRCFLTVVDLSGWLHHAWHMPGGEYNMVATVVGWIARLLSDPMPPTVVFAVDPEERTTWRDELTAHLDPKLRYKANRPPKSEIFRGNQRRILEIIDAYAIPVLTPAGLETQSYDADDAAATAVRLCQIEQRGVALVSADKDWLQLVCDDALSPPVIRWDTRNRVEGPKEVRDKYGVEPWQMAHYLALCGDESDNIPGVHGVGEKGARLLVQAFGTIHKALDTDAFDVPELPIPRDAATLRRMHKLLQEQRDAALGSLALVRLKDDAPIQWDKKAQAVGGFDVRRLRKIYAALGFSQLADSIPDFEKGELPWQTA